MKIDFVVAWVDGNDEQWQKKKEQYVDVKQSSKSSSGASRYRDWEIFKYWFRAVEKYAPWVNKVFLVTDRQVPDFLDLDCEKLQVVYHDEYIPAQYLPTFNANPIEINFHRIDGLSEYFVYFNDDMFLNKPVTPSDFFVDGKPCYELVERPVVPQAPVNMMMRICINDMGVINNHFSRKNILKHFSKFINFKYGKAAFKNLFMLPWNNFQHFQDNHMPCPFLKSTLAEVWEKEYAVCDSTSSHKFRSHEDINQYVFKYWDLARGNFEPYHFVGGYYCIDESNINELIYDIENGNHMMLCINDSEYLEESKFFEFRKKLIMSFDKIYPQKSKYEY